MLQLEEPRRGSPSVEGAAGPHWIPQLLQVHHHTLIILSVMDKIHFTKMLEMIMMTVGGC